MNDVNYWISNTAYQDKKKARSTNNFFEGCSPQLVVDGKWGPKTTECWLKMRYTDITHPIPTPNLNCKPKCIAIKQDGERCTRSCKKNSVYCGKHIKLDKQQNKDEILTWEEYIEGNKYLVDSENYVYIKNGEGAEIVGKKNKNKIVNIV